MESNDKNTGMLSIGKQIWLKYFKWIIVAIVLLFVGLIWYVSYRAKKNALATVAQDISYPPDVVAPTQSQISAFNEWTKTTGMSIIVTLGEELNNYWIRSSVIVDALITLSQTTDKQLIWVANNYQKKYAGRTLAKDLDKIYILFTTKISTEATDTAKRIRRLGGQ